VQNSGDSSPWNWRRFSLGGGRKGDEPGALVVEDKAKHVRAGGDGGLGVGQVGDSANFYFGAHD